MAKSKADVDVKKVELIWRKTLTPTKRIKIRRIVGAKPVDWLGALS